MMAMQACVYHAIFFTVGLVLTVGEDRDEPRQPRWCAWQLQRGEGMALLPAVTCMIWFSPSAVRMAAKLATATVSTDGEVTIRGKSLTADSSAALYRYGAET